jgi:hypothetical protein
MMLKPTRAEPPILQVRDLVRAFGGIVAVNGFNLDVYQGTIHGLIGPNGAGKNGPAAFARFSRDEVLELVSLHRKFCASKRIAPTAFWWCIVNWVRFVNNASRPLSRPPDGIGSLVAQPLAAKIAGEPTAST